MPLESRDQQHLDVAHGYMELGMYEEANTELEKSNRFAAICQKC